MSLNKWFGLGNLVRDPELRVTAKGTSICQFGLAINSNYTTKDGEKREEVTFVDCEAWGKQGEVIAKYCTKGKPLLVECRLKLDVWEKDGEKRSKLKAVVENFQFVGGKNEQAGERGDVAERPAQRAQTGVQQTRTVDEEDVPFG